jgi:hypothetical protein
MIFEKLRSFANVNIGDNPAPLIDVALIRISVVPLSTDVVFDDSRTSGTTGSVIVN